MFEKSLHAFFCAWVFGSVALIVSGVVSIGISCLAFSPLLRLLMTTAQFFKERDITYTLLGVCLAAVLSISLFVGIF